MPEILEVESYRSLADQVVGARISRGFADSYLAKKLTSPSAWARAVSSHRVRGTGRRGKLMWLETDGPRLGFRFGMTGVLLIDHDPGIDGLFYGPHEFRDSWVRGGVEFDDGRRLIVHDPRRLARVEIEPDLSDLGPDALSLTLAELREALKVRGEGPPIKARLLDQSKIAGIGNLLGDEILFRARIDPRRPVGRLSAREVAQVHRTLTSTLHQLAHLGGSHLGRHMAGRTIGGFCPLDGAAMRVDTIGGRTTYWCSSHQV